MDIDVNAYKAWYKKEYKDKYKTSKKMTGSEESLYSKSAGEAFREYLTDLIESNLLDSVKSS